jgi:hypothetical protein
MSFIITGMDSAGAVSLKRGSAAAAIKKAPPGRCHAQER